MNEVGVAANPVASPIPPEKKPLPPEEVLELLARSFDEDNALEQAVGLTQADQRHATLLAFLPSGMGDTCPMMARVNALLSEARGGAAPVEPATGGPSHAELWLKLVGLEQKVHVSDQGLASKRDSIRQALCDAGYDAERLCERARQAAAFVGEAVARGIERRRRGISERPVRPVLLTGAHAAFWRDVIPKLDDKALDAMLDTLDYTPLEIHIMGDRGNREDQALQHIVERGADDWFGQYGAFSTTVPEPIAFDPAEYVAALAEHERLLHEHHDALLASMRAPHCEEGPFGMVDHRAGLIRRSGGAPADVSCWSRGIAAFCYRRYHGIYRELFLGPPLSHVRVVIQACGAVSLRLLEVQGPDSERPRLVPTCSAVLVEPERQTHRIVGDQIRTTSVTPRSPKRVDTRPLLPRPRPVEVVDRLFALYEPLVREKLGRASEGARVDEPGDRAVVIRSSPLYGDSVNVFPRGLSRAFALGYSGIHEALGEAPPGGWIPVLIGSAGHGGLRWVPDGSGSQGPVPAPRDEEWVFDVGEAEE